MKSVVKHKYIGGGREGKAKARAHLNYIQYRDGKDRLQGARPFFDRDRDKTDGAEFRERLNNSNQRSAVLHKLILSPGCNGIDLKEYTREIMEELADAKGIELDWEAVIHTNTEHEHVHVALLGKTSRNKILKITKDDYDAMRAVGDRYLERKHEFDRYYDNSIDRIIADETRHRDFEIAELLKPYRAQDEHEEKSARRSKKDQDENRNREQTGTDRDEQQDKEKRERDEDKDQRLSEERKEQDEREEKEKEDERERNEKERERQRTSKRNAQDREKKEKAKRKQRGKSQKEKPLHDEERPARLPERRKPRKQRLMENRGRNDFFHDLYVSSINKKRLEQLKEQQPDLGPEIDAQLEAQQQHDRERIAGYEKTVSQLDRILGIAKKEKPKEKENYKDFDRRDLDLSKVAKEDKIYLRNGEVITKYDTLGFLEGTNDRLKFGPRDQRLNQDDFRKLSSWREAKRERGDAAFGEPPKISGEEKEMRRLERLVSSLNRNLEGLDSEKDQEKIKQLKAECFERMFNPDSSSRNLSEHQIANKIIRKDQQRTQAATLRERLAASSKEKDKEKIKKTLHEFLYKSKGYDTPQKAREPLKTALNELQEEERINKLTYKMHYEVEEAKQEGNTRKAKQLEDLYSLEIASPSTRLSRTGQVESREKEYFYELNYKLSQLQPNEQEKRAQLMAEHAKKMEELNKEREQPKPAPERSSFDFDRVDADDKISLKNGEKICKYDSREFLLSVDKQLKDGPSSDRLDKDEYSKMWKWIGVKEKYGDDCYGRAPLIGELEQGKPVQLSLEEEKQEVDRINKLTYEMVFKTEQLDPVKDFDEIKDLKAKYLQEIKEAGSTEISKNADSKDKEIEESQRVNSLMQQLHFRSRQLDPLKDEKELAALIHEYQQEIKEPGSTSFASVSERPPSAEEIEQAEAARKEEIDKQRLEEISDKLASVLIELDFEKDAEKIQKTLEQSLRLAENAEGFVTETSAAESWKSKEQEELERIAQILADSSSTQPETDEKQELAQIREEEEKFWALLAAPRENHPDREIDAHEEQNLEPEEKQAEQKAEINVAELIEQLVQKVEKELEEEQSRKEPDTFELVFQALKEMIEERIRQEEQRRQKEQEEREKEEKEKEKREREERGEEDE